MTERLQDFLRRGIVLLRKESELHGHLPIQRLISSLRMLAVLFACCLCGHLSAESRYIEDYPTAASKKGLQVEMISDALELGIKHAAINVNLSQLVDPRGESNGPTWKFEGRNFQFKRKALERLDQQIKPLSDQGVVVDLIILAYQSGDDTINELMLHPKYDTTAPNRLGAFNCVTEEGKQWFIATLQFLAERWSRPDRKFGRAVGFIIGNEVNSHWWWSNRGQVDFDAFAKDYLRTVKLAHDAIRSQSSCARIYLSLDHHWNIRYPAGSPKQTFAGKRLIDYFAQHVPDLDWHLAYHPYPENLFDPRFWYDKTATQTPETHRITFKNLSVLTDYFSRNELLHNGKPRRIILSEQGFHSGKGEAGERLQAAAYCYAYRKVVGLAGIDALILHRHIDHPHEGGLNLGLRRRDGNARPKKPIYDCFQLADAPDWRQAFKFALPIVGLSDWPLPDEYRFIENQTIRLGVNMKAGGAIGYLARQSDKRNLLNHYDRGRFIQQSYYGDQDDSKWNDKPWRWNPVQGGDWRGNSSIVLASEFKDTSLTITTRPRHWASGKMITDVEMKTDIQLYGPLASIAYEFQYRGNHRHATQHQELPAVFVDSALKNLVFYRGDKPWSKASLSRKIPAWPNEYDNVDESWVAYVDDNDWGIGIYSKGMDRITCYRHRGDNKTGPTAAACSYVAPIKNLKIVPGFKNTYRVAITIGKLHEIRERFYALHEKQNE